LLGKKLYTGFPVLCGYAFLLFVFDTG